MELRELSRIDLNLVVALQALLEEGSVSRAATRMFISQSAMSKTLSRLRELFQDPLFVRRGAIMEPTPRAQSLALQIVPVLESLQQLVQPDNFAPSQYRGEFRILIPSYFGPWFIPGLVQRLQDRAPYARLHVVSSSDNQMEALASGELDFSCQVERHMYKSGFEMTPVGTAAPLLIASERHPLCGNLFGWEEILVFPQVQLIIPELRELMFVEDESSDFVRYERKVIPHVQTDNLLTALQLVRQSDFLFPSPPLLLGEKELSNGLVRLPLPGSDSLRLAFVLVNHKRISHSPAHQFFRDLAIETVNSLREQFGFSPL